MKRAICLGLLLFVTVSHVAVGAPPSRSAPPPETTFEAVEASASLEWETVKDALAATTSACDCGDEFDRKDCVTAKAAAATTLTTGRRFAAFLPYENIDSGPYDFKSGQLPLKVTGRLHDATVKRCTGPSCAVLLDRTSSADAVRISAGDLAWSGRVALPEEVARAVRQSPREIRGQAVFEIVRVSQSYEANDEIASLRKSLLQLHRVGLSAVPQATPARLRSCEARTRVRVLQVRLVALRLWRASEPESGFFLSVPPSTHTPAVFRVREFVDQLSGRCTDNADSEACLRLAEWLESGKTGRNEDASALAAYRTACAIQRGEDAGSCPSEACAKAALLEIQRGASQEELAAAGQVLQSHCGCRPNECLKPKAPELGLPLPSPGARDAGTPENMASASDASPEEAEPDADADGMSVSGLASDAGTEAPVRPEAGAPLAP